MSVATPVLTGRKGRPRLEIDWDEFEKLCKMQCTLTEIASWFECSEDTVTRRVAEEYNQTFQEVHTQLSAHGKASLRRMQFELAMSGDRVMQIWLGKQYLGQRDKQPGEEDRTVKHEGEIGVAKIDLEERVKQIRSKV